MLAIRRGLSLVWTMIPVGGSVIGTFNCSAFRYYRLRCGCWQTVPIHFVIGIKAVFNYLRRACLIEMIYNRRLYSFFIPIAFSLHFQWDFLLSEKSFPEQWLCVPVILNGTGRNPFLPFYQKNKKKQFTSKHRANWHGHGEDVWESTQTVTWTPYQTGPCIGRDPTTAIHCNSYKDVLYSVCVHACVFVKLQCWIKPSNIAKQFPRKHICTNFER